jgi:Flp pilus assembly protein TadG
MQRSLEKLLHWIARFGAKSSQLSRENRGNIALITALCLVPLVVAAGGAVDIGEAVSRRSALQDAADAAALAAANAANTYVVQYGSGTTQLAQANQLAASTAQHFMTVNASNLGLTAAPTVTATTTVSANVASVQLNVTGQITTSFLPLLGMKTLPIGVTSITTMSPGAKYYQIIFLIDVSNSMAIGGTSGAITALQNNTQIGCAFACHDPNSYSAATTSCLTPVDTCDKRAIAANAKILLKIDYVNQAVQSFITQLGPYAALNPNHFFVGINTYGAAFNATLTPTTDLATAKTTASAIDVEPALPYAANYGYTYTKAALSSTLQTLKNVGDGSSASQMLTYVIFLSDAVEDVPGVTQWGRTTDLGYTSACTALKAGVNVFSIWAPYYAIPGDSQYDALVAPINSQLGPTMQGCASSPSQYFTANDGPAIQSAVNSTFNIIIANSHLRIAQ